MFMEQEDGAAAPAMQEGAPGAAQQVPSPAYRAAAAQAQGARQGLAPERAERAKCGHVTTATCARQELPSYSYNALSSSIEGGGEGSPY